MAEKKIKKIKLSDEQVYDIDAKYWDGHLYSDLGRAIKFIGEATTTAPTAGTYVKAKAGNTTYYIAQTTTGTATERAAEKGDVFIITSSGKEYICTTAGVSTASAWTVLGDENTYASKAAAGKAGTYTSTAPSTNATGEAGAQTATGTATVTYKKSATATGSKGAATITSTEGGAVSIAYTPEGTISAVSAASHSHTVNVTKATVNNNVTGTATGNAGEHSHTINSHTHGDNVTVVTGVTAAALGGTTSFNTDAIKSASLATDTATTPTFSFNTDAIKSASLNGTTTFNTDAIKDVTLSASTVTSDGPKYIESVTHTAASLTGDTSFVKSITAWSGGSLTGTKTFNTDAIKSIGGTKNYGFSASQSNIMTAPAVSEDGVLSWTLKSAGTQDAHTGTAASKASVGFTAATATITGGSVGISGGGITPVTKYMKRAVTAASTGTVGITTTAATKAGIKVTTTAATKGTVTLSGGVASGTASVAGAKSAATLTSSTVADHNHTLTNSTLEYVSSATLSKAGAISVTPTFTGTSVTLTQAAHTHNVTIADHTHSITLTDTTITGTAAVAVSGHTHTLSNHTHNVTIPNCAA